MSSVNLAPNVVMIPANPEFAKASAVSSSPATRRNGRTTRIRSWRIRSGLWPACLLTKE